MINGYENTLTDLIKLLESSRRAAARSVNAIMTATYWEIGRRIVELEQGGEKRAEYGAAVITRLSEDLTARYSKGFSERNLELMRRFYLKWQISQTLSAESNLSTLAQEFPLPWSHYVRLLSVHDLKSREFYETEALRGGWSERQLKRQIESKFYERVALSQNKTALLKKGEKKQAEDILTPEQELKDSFVLEFLGLKDEYSESDLEQALINKLEYFLLELGSEFAFVGRQKRLRVGDECYRIDLLFFHRVLKCLIVIDLKLGKLTPADTGQMNFYVNYAREHWTYPGENPPVGLILCSEKDEAVAHYALDNLPNILAREYQLKLPDEEKLAAQIEEARKSIEEKM
ncbi:PDDEXK nuclease domain-containing protein [uncultured Nostoc sp.]|uniref:PDDEXK nuclease domain-containing protein n=1 Tax=uncultured Nostoc sp. TaxID=340711 RepID=UPI00261A0B0E|nr:PDDEXK nuclease domain-containing protein [uncultured Nostoc sp.]